ncbi:MAG: 2-amino-4-hydroxy-6-hydroxymethyldihydropteridine diphosphokinase [Porticoccaceae bacterium]|jgi:2-amino-4-hydroxy-6-hydroxymethyldihydropteridine diphosphokinase|nr:2-amino-4-hydroxy-6-hydroxymethyldihydropteridine diphosphokinase [Porticoccaceae bacterium]MEA3299197.1 2-amino-4-hydroxy-6-hydroxymethyldihydropteridine diphosphokinase [Pseudomonadota bacterium]HLS98878.1 2-amino-4-hydroxy-6-hydroxymethyldihydropteridine diphosphokinase [Porticoccaceae bacterium]
MARVYLSIGSNIDQRRHILACLDALAAHFGELILSSVYESEAVGFGGDNFYNLVAGVDTELPVAALAPLLRRIENDNGRRRDGPRFSSRTLDIDILTWDDLAGEVDGVVLPREEVLDNAFVLWPLAEIAAGERHPVVGKTYGELWTAYDKAGQRLWPIDFSWRGRVISVAAPPAP